MPEQQACKPSKPSKNQIKLQEDIQLITGILTAYPTPEAIPSLVRDRILGVIKDIEKRAYRRGLKAQYCGCGWCCRTVPYDRRGELHKKTCR